MSLLDQLWDDTVAGPPPDTGLGKLRKHQIFASRPSPGRESGNGAPDDGTRVTRSIMIVKPPQGGSPPISPAGSTPPVSPFAGKPAAD